MTALFIVITLLALIFGAILGFASLKLKVMPYYRKASAVSAVIPAVNLMLKLLLMAISSQNAFRADDQRW